MIIAGEDQNSFIGWVESNIGYHSFCVSLNSGSGFKLGYVDIQSLVVDKDLSLILEPISHEIWFREKLEKFKTAKSLATGIQNIVCELTAGNDLELGNESALPQLLMRHLDNVGWDRIMKVNRDFTIIQMRSIDFSGREHIFDVLINPGYPTVSPTVRANLPDHISIPWSETSELTLIISVVDKEIKKFEKLFVELSELDTQTWVLEPAQPSFAISSRRLAIERSCSIVLDINAQKPRDICQMNFFGPPNRVNHFRVSLNQNLHLWSKENSIKENLEKVLGIELPNKNIDSSANENLCEECGICYTYSIFKLSDESSSNLASNKDKKLPPNSFIQTDSTATAVSVPDQACSNKKCCKIYHFNCLVDWLQSLPSSKTSFGTLFGSCPYCQEAISVRIQR
jgi:E3 ubiquitin-protein ligase FANCL